MNRKKAEPGLMSLSAGLRLYVGVPSLVLATLAMMPVQVAAIRLAPPVARRLPLIWHRLALAILGVRIRVRGEVPRERPLLIVSNHISWFDIVVLGSIMELSFIAKSEVKGWPGISWLARLQRTVFIEREQRNQVVAQADSIAGRLAGGDAMVLFAEGTTGDGHRLQPFKSALFGALQRALGQSGTSWATVQPVAIAYTRLHGLPLGRLHQGRASWPGDVELAGHILAFLRQGAYDVEVAFGEPSRFDTGTRRKAIAEATYRKVRHDFSHLMRMRHEPESLDRPANER